MKVLVLVVLALGLAQSAHASDVTVTGEKAQNIMAALYDAGATGDAGMGRSGTSAANLVCQVIVAAQSSASCKGDLQSASGDLVSTVIAPDKSLALAQALQAANVTSTCVPGGCQIEVKGLDCTQPNDPSDTDPADTNCSIGQ